VIILFSSRTDAFRGEMAEMNSMLKVLGTSFIDTDQGMEAGCV